MQAINSTNASFTLFSTVHLITLGIFILCILLLFLFRNHNLLSMSGRQLLERGFAVSLLFTEIAYHLSLYVGGIWKIEDSLPFELSSISLLLTIILLWTGNRNLYVFVFFAGIGGALQAFLTPVLTINFPHFRFFHFFYTHGGVIITALYFTWIKGYAPKFKDIFKALLMLNIVAAFVYMMNFFTDGNYMFLREKPVTASLLDYLGPYPFYIISLEAVALIVFIGLWAIFRNRKDK